MAQKKFSSEDKGQTGHRDNETTSSLVARNRRKRKIKVPCTSERRTGRMAVGI